MMVVMQLLLGAPASTLVASQPQISIRGWAV